MKKITKICMLYILFMITLSLGKNVKANTINQLNMDVYIDNKGDATITEIWDCYVNGKTEMYHPYYDIGKSEITNLTVKEGEKKYETLYLWNVSATMEEKAYKCGINKTSNGVELCWGISSYGSHKYEVQYKISKFIANLNDSQMIYWTLVTKGFSDPIGKAYIKIHTDFNIPNTTDVWGYGNYGGTAYVYNGYIEMQSKGKLASSDYMTILVKFPKNTFNVIENDLNYNFNYYYNLAEVGAQKYNEESRSEKILIWAVVVFWSVVFLIKIMLDLMPPKENKITKRFKLKKYVFFYRELPSENDLLKVYTIAYDYGIINKKTDILGAIVLKWVKEKKVKIKKEEKKWIFGTEKISLIMDGEFSQYEKMNNSREYEIFNMMKNAIKDEVLENKEFANWCKLNYSIFLKWFENVIEYGEKKLQDEGILYKKEKKILGLIKYTSYKDTKELQKKAGQILGLKKYLKHYTLLRKRKTIEVELFEDYLIYAQMFGIAKNVSKEFKKIYPNMVKQSCFNSYSDLECINYSSSEYVRTAFNAEARANDYSSDGGGFFSGGGRRRLIWWRRKPEEVSVKNKKERKQMKKIAKIFILCILFIITLSLGKNVKANTINQMNMDVYIDNNGDAIITETWSCYVDSKTEMYHPYYGIGKSKITDLTVKEGERKYETLSSWKVSATMEEKAYKCGINKISNGVELCWGVSKYGSHKYEVQYKISKFVANLYDSQMVYWTLVTKGFSNPIGKAYIKIHTDFDIPDTTDVWGYGNYGGTAYVYNGYIEMQPKESLASNEYMTILVKFPRETFNVTKNDLNHNFDYYYNLAEEGSIKYNDKSESIFSKILNIILQVLEVLFAIVIIFILPIFALYDSSVKSRVIKSFKLRRTDEINYYRDIPCKKDLFKAYAIGYSYGLVKKKTDLLGAVILKWVKEKKVRIEKREKTGLFDKDDDITIIMDGDIIQDNMNINQEEYELFQMLKRASGDGVLDSTRFKKWSERHYSKFLGWFDTVLEKEEKILINEKLIKENDKKVMGIINYRALEETEELKEIAKQLAGLKKYLKDYTLIEERRSIEVEIFEEYLIYAQMLGIAKEVSKEFKEIYPDMIEQSCFDSYDNLDCIHYSSSAYVRAASNSYNEARARSYSSGGGGFSSGGGRRRLIWWRRKPEEVSVKKNKKI